MILIRKLHVDHLKTKIDIQYCSYYNNNNLSLLIIIHYLKSYIVYWLFICVKCKYPKLLVSIIQLF